MDKSQEYMNAISIINWSGEIDAVEASRIEKYKKDIEIYR